MEFSRIGDHTIKCVISEEEIEDLGFTLDEIMSNGERTQEFMNHIFDLAEEKYAMKFDIGVKTVRADFMPDHTLSLTFSEHQGTAMMEHLKDIVNGFLNAIPQDKWDELKKTSAEDRTQNELEAGDTDNEDEEVRVIALFTFAGMDVLMRFAALVRLEEIPPNMLYKYQNSYILIMNLSNCTEEEVLHLSILTDEYAADIAVGGERKAFIEEHGEPILKQNAIEQLKQVAS